MEAHPSDAKRFARVLISITNLRTRKSGFEVNDWILDSGAFSIIQRHRGYPESESVAVYAEHIRRWSANGNLLAAVAQDYMCDPYMLARTGLSVAGHQRLTIERYDALVAERTGVYILPVLQGWRPSDYVSHIRQYGKRLRRGSVWAPSASATPILERSIRVLVAIHAERSDLRLHGFGIKLTSLAVRDVQRLLATADSMAWSMLARMVRRRGVGSGSHDWRIAKAFCEQVEAMCRPLPTGPSEWLKGHPVRSALSKSLP